VLSRPNVGLSPETPQNDAGIRIEPPVSVPSASAACPKPSATAEPPLEPPGTRSGSCGFRHGGKCALTEVMPQANSCVSVLPTTIAPASRARATTHASAFGTCPEKMLDPYVVRTPAVSNRSLTASVSPSSGRAVPSL
jgi:hypothetical protein